MTKRDAKEPAMKQREVRFGDADWAEVLEMAKADRRTASGYLRRLVKDDVDRKRKRRS